MLSSQPLISSVCVKSELLRAARRPVVIFGGAIGDHLLLIPALRALDRLFPGRLELVCFPRRWQAYYRDIKFGAIHEKVLGWNGEEYLFDADNLIGEAADCDLVISFNSWHHPEIDRFLQTVQPANSLGYFPGFTLVPPLPPVREKHVIDMTFELVQMVDPDLQPEDFSFAPSLADQHRQRARNLRKDMPSGAKLLVVHADTKPEKMWESDRFVEVLNLFLAHHPEYVAVVVGQQDLGLQSGPHADRILTYLELPQLTALSVVGEADLFVGVDSCMLHAADLFGIPGVSLFGPTSPAQWGFRCSRHHRDLQGQDQKMASLTARQALEALEEVEREAVTSTNSKA